MAIKTMKISASRLPCGGTPYEDVAGLLQATGEKFGEEGKAIIGTLAHSFSILFANNNPNFDRPIFLLTCGLENRE